MVFCVTCIQIQDPKAGFVVNGFVTVSATVLVLKETLQFVREGDSSSDNLRCASILIQMATS